MSPQLLIVAPVVAICAAQAAWTLLPPAARRALVACLLRWPVPARVATRLRLSQQRQGGCGCDGCERSERPPAAPGAQPIRIHRRGSDPRRP